MATATAKHPVLVFSARSPAAPCPPQCGQRGASSLIATPHDVHGTISAISPLSFRVFA